MKSKFFTGDLVTNSFGWDCEIYVYIADDTFGGAPVAIVMGLNGNIKKFYEIDIRLLWSPL